MEVRLDVDAFQIPKDRSPGLQVPVSYTAHARRPLLPEPVLLNVNKTKQSLKNRFWKVGNDVTMSGSKFSPECSVHTGVEERTLHWRRIRIQDGDRRPGEVPAVRQGRLRGRERLRRYTRPFISGPNKGPPLFRVTYCY